MRVFLSVWFVLALAALAPGCGGGRSAPDELVIALEANPGNFDPRLARDVYSDKVNKLVYDGLTRVDRTGRPVPRLAVSWEMESPTSYRFRLKDGVKFHDGRPFTARDAAYTLESVRDPALVSPLKGTFDVLERIEVISDTELRLVLKAPSVSLLGDLSLGIVPEGSGPDTLKTSPVGTGPYRFVDYEPSERVRLEASPQGNWPRPPVPKVTFRVIPNETSRVLGLLHGSVDLSVNDITPLYADYLKKEGFQVRSGPGTNYTYLAFNLKDPVLANHNVRLAFAHAIDRDRLVRYRLRGLARPATGYLPDFHWAYRRPQAVYGHDPALAKKLLAEAGYPDGIRIEWKTSTSKEALRNIEVMREDLEQAGIHVEVKSYEWAALFDQIVKGQFQIFTLQWVGIGDPDMMYSIFHSAETPEKGGRNRGRYSNPEVDRLLAEARAETDSGRRADLYGRVQELVADDLPYVPLYWRDNIVVAGNSLKDVDVEPSAAFWFVENVRKEARP